MHITPLGGGKSKRSPTCPVGSRLVDSPGCFALPASSFTYIVHQRLLILCDLMERIIVD